MDTKLYWTTDSTTCANCGAQLSRTGRHLSVKRGSEPVPIWTCESCDMDFVQYQDNSAVIQFEKSVFCKYLPDFLGSTVKAIKDAEENQSVSGLKNLSDAAKYLVEADRLAEEQARIAAQKALEAAKERVLRAARLMQRRRPCARLRRSASRRCHTRGSPCPEKACNYGCRPNASR